MKKNRNRRKHVKTSSYPATLAGVLVLAALLSLSYLWLRGRCESLGREISRLEDQKIALQRQRVNEEYKWSAMTSPENMQKLLKTHNLQMAWPREKSVVRIYRNQTTQIASRGSGDARGKWMHD
jgi:hypothetical protein